MRGNLPIANFGRVSREDPFWRVVVLNAHSIRIMKG